MMGDENSVYIASACRTPIGSMGGTLKNVPAHELGSIVIKESLKRAAVKSERVNEVIMGQVLTGGQGPNPARLAALKAGIPSSATAYTVNMLCGSGLKSIYLGCQSILNGDAFFVVAGGQENMSMAHHSVLMRPGVRYGHTQFTDNVLSDGLVDPTLHMHMGDTAEHLAQKYKVSRIRQDEFANQSQTKVRVAKENGFFYDEITPVEAREGKVAYTMYEDEYPKPETSMETLSKLRPCFKGVCKEPCHRDAKFTQVYYYKAIERSITAGNSSGINDGAAAVVLCTSQEAGRLSEPPLARIVGFGQAGVEPEEMGMGPIPAVRNLLYKIKWTIDDVDLFEINEAFAAQTILCAQDLRIPQEKLNINGGAIALGHPIGCSGTRVLVTLLYNMRRMNKRRGIAAVCIGGGMGIAIGVERTVS